MFRIFYGDGSTFDGDGPGEDWPSTRDIQAIIQSHPKQGAEIVLSGDYYIWNREKWNPVDLTGLLLWLMDSGYVLFGQTIDNDDFSQVVRVAREEMGKAGWLPRERKP